MVDLIKDIDVDDQNPTNDHFLTILEQAFKTQIIKVAQGSQNKPSTSSNKVYEDKKKDQVEEQIISASSEKKAAQAPIGLKRNEA